MTYGRELKFQEQLNKAGFETFLPMKRKKVEKAGKQMTVIVPAVSNLLFVNALKADLDAFINDLGESSPARYIWDRANNRPAIVQDQAMKNFIKVCQVMSDEVLYIQDLTEKLREGHKVRILEGPFIGVEGVVVRIRKSRRVVVDLPGMLAVATTYIQPQNLEIIE